jgi:hypothetical protein
VRYYEQPRLVMMHAVYPNPVRDKARIYYTLKADAEVKLFIYNVAGEKIAMVGMLGRRGKNELVWEGTNNDGGRCASGFYILHLKAAAVGDGTQDAVWARCVLQR